MRDSVISALDLIERYIFIGVYGFFSWRMVSAYLDGGLPITLIYLADQLLVLGFLVFRRRTHVLSPHPGDWLVGFCGTLLPLLVVAPSGQPIVPLPLILAFSLGGLMIHLSAKLSLRRSFGIVAANRGVMAEGSYKLVRHPMYLGYMVAHVGILLAGPNVVNVAAIAGCWVCLILRIAAEERVLTGDAAYRELCRRTRWRLIPGVY